MLIFVKIIIINGYGRLPLGNSVIEAVSARRIRGGAGKKYLIIGIVEIRIRDILA